MTEYDPQSDPSPYRPPVKKSGRTFAWGVGRAIVWFVYTFALVAIVIATIAFVLQLFGADPNNDFAQWIYRSASRVTAPFRGIFPTHTNGNSVVDVSLLFAILMYALFALLVSALIDYIDRRRDQSLSRDRYEEQQAALHAPGTPGVGFVRCRVPDGRVGVPTPDSRVWRERSRQPSRRAGLPNR